MVGIFHLLFTSKIFGVAGCLGRICEARGTLELWRYSVMKIISLVRLHGPAGLKQTLGSWLDYVLRRTLAWSRRFLQEESGSESLFGCQPWCIPSPKFKWVLGTSKVWWPYLPSFKIKGLYFIEEFGIFVLSKDMSGKILYHGLLFPAFLWGIVEAS